MTALGGRGQRRASRFYWHLPERSAGVPSPVSRLSSPGSEITSNQLYLFNNQEPSSDRYSGARARPSSLARDFSRRPKGAWKHDSSPTILHKLVSARRDSAVPRRGSSRSFGTRSAPGHVRRGEDRGLRRVVGSWRASIMVNPLRATFLLGRRPRIAETRTTITAAIRSTCYVRANHAVRDG